MKYPQDDPKIALLIIEAQEARAEWDRMQLTGQRNSLRYKRAMQEAHRTSQALTAAKQSFYQRQRP